MSVDALLDRLQKVRKTATGKWTACCPAHEDKNPSLAIAEGDDGRVLIKCFAACPVEDILSAVGLTFDAIFPERLKDHQYKPIRKPFPAADTLEMLRTEVMIVWLAACDISKGIALDTEKKARLDKAASLIEVAIDG